MVALASLPHTGAAKRHYPPLDDARDQKKSAGVVIRCYASFRLGGEALRSAVLTEQLGLDPDYAHEMGEARPGHDRPWRNGVWGISSEKRLASADLDEHLRLLLDLFEPSSEPLHRLIRDQSLAADFFCFVSGDGQGGPTLTPATMARIASLGAELALDIYFESTDE